MVRDITALYRAIYTMQNRPQGSVPHTGGRYRIRTYHLNNVNVAL